MKKVRKSISLFTVMAIFLLSFSMSVSANSHVTTDCYSYTDENGNQDGNFVLVLESMDISGENTRVSSKTVTSSYNVYYSGVYICSITFRVTFAYNIVTNDGIIAEITGSDVTVSGASSGANYYIIASNITKTYQNGNPAKATFSVPIYSSSNGSRVGTLVYWMDCYANGTVETQ